MSTLSSHSFEGPFIKKLLYSFSSSKQQFFIYIAVSKAYHQFNSMQLYEQHSKYQTFFDAMKLNDIKLIEFPHYLVDQS